MAYQSQKQQEQARQQQQMQVNAQYYDTLQHSASSSPYPTSSPSSSWNARKDQQFCSSSPSTPPGYVNSDVLYSYQQQHNIDNKINNPNNNNNPDESLRSSSHHNNNSTMNSHHKHHHKQRSKDEMLQLRHFASNGSGGSSGSSTNRQGTPNSIPSIFRLQESLTNGTATDFTEPDGHIMLQDWLQKRSTALQMVWKRRWCVLRDNRLFYYRSNTDTKPLGVLHLADYSILSSGSEITRKSKYAFRLSSPDHQNQSHVFFSDTAQSLDNWTHALQIHINQAVAALLSLAEASDKLGRQLRENENTNQTAAGRGAHGAELSIIDKVLDRLQLEDPSPSETSSTVSSQQRVIVREPITLLQSYDENADTWSSVSSIHNTSSNNSSNLDYIFALNQQQSTQHLAKSSMDSMRESQQNNNCGSNSNNNMVMSGSQSIHSVSSNNGYLAGPAFSEHLSVSSMSDGSRSARQSMESQGRPSLQQSRSGMASGNSPLMNPIRSSGQSGASIDNNSSPGASTIDSPYSSPALKSQSHTIPNNAQGTVCGGPVPPPASPMTFYRILENSKEAGSIGSSISISSLGPSGDASTAVDTTLDSSSSVAATESNHGCKQSGGNLFLDLVTGGKHRKDKERRAQNGSGSSQGGNGGSGGSSSLKMFPLSVCSHSGCTQPAKSCPLHSKKSRPESPMKPMEKEIKKIKKLWPGSDKNVSQGALSVASSSIYSGSDRCSSPVQSIVSPKPRASKSMTSLSRGNNEFEINSNPMPQLSNPLLNILPTPSRRRSPSVSIVDDVLVAAQTRHQQHHHTLQTQQKQIQTSDPIQQQSILQQQQQQQQQLQPTGTSQPQSKTPPSVLPAAPMQPLPLPPLHMTTTELSTIPQSRTGGSGALSRKMGLLLGDDFGTSDKSKSPNSPLEGNNFFVANHHRTMQKLQGKNARKNQPANSGSSSGSTPSTNPLSAPSTPIQASFGIDQQRYQMLQQQQQLQASLQIGGVSRHIVAPDELALAIEQEAEDMRRQQAEAIEYQRNRPTSMIGNAKIFQSLPINVGLLPLSETASDSGVSAGDSLSESIGQLSSTSSGQMQVEGERIISSQEQLTCGLTALTSAIQQPVERQRSPISGITSTTSSPRSNVTKHPYSSSVPLTDSELSAVAGDVDNSSGINISVTTTTPTFEYPPQSPHSQGLYDQFHKQSRPSMSCRTLSFDEKEEEYPFRSLPPPKRRGSDKAAFQADLVNHEAYRTFSRQTGPPRRSSATATTGTGSAPWMPMTKDDFATLTELTERDDSSTSDVSGGNARASSSPSMSSSPVIIRLSEQGGQNISPLINNNSPRTFAGSVPSNDVRRPCATPTTSSPSGSSQSTSTVSSTLCSIAGPDHVRNESFEAESNEEHHSGLALGGASSPAHHTPNVMSPISEDVPVSPIPLNNSSKLRSILSPLASATPINGNSPLRSPGSSPASSVMRVRLSEDSESEQQQDEEGQVASESQGAQNGNEDDSKGMSVPSVVVNSPHETISQRRDATHRNIMMQMQAAQNFVFPAPRTSTSTTASADASSTNDQPPSSRTSIDYFSSTAVSSEASTPNGEEGDVNRSHPSSPGHTASALRAHMAALDLYPGLRKLSLFTAAVGNNPPPALIMGRRKGSAGSACARERKMSTASSFSRMESDDDHDEEYDDDQHSVDLQHDEDWAGNLKSLKGKNGSYVPPMPDAIKHRPSLPFVVRSSSGALTMQLSTPPPSSPLPHLPPRTAHTPSNPLRVIADNSGTTYTSLLRPPPSPSSSSPTSTTTAATAATATATTTAGAPYVPRTHSPLIPSEVNPPAIPRRSPQRSVPSSPTLLKS
ncbi:hypothetical protein BGX20_000398 [Mortierella sp. AD010]|nr:hypothetical protein BGX20_000398 [Mortierella sp. AD010]